MKLSDSTIQAIIDSEAFKKSTYKLVGQLKNYHLTVAEARQDLITELLTKRLNNDYWTNETVLLQLEGYQPTKGSKEPRLLPLIGYARMDAAEEYWKKDKREKAKSDKLTDRLTPADMSKCDAYDLPSDTTAEAIAMTGDIFANAKTREWITSVLNHGKAETMAKFDQTPKQFAKKMTKVVSFCNTHPEKLEEAKFKNHVECFLSDEERALGELIYLHDFTDAIEKEDATDKEVQAWIDENQACAI